MSFEQLFGSLVGGLFAIGGLFVCITAIRDAMRYSNAEYFPSVIGTIQWSGIDEQYPKWWEADESPKTTYYAKVRYEYVVDGVYFESDTVHFAGPEIYSDRKEAQAIVDKYPKNSQVTVYYKRGNPKLSALELGGIEFRTNIGIFLGFVFLAVGGWLIVYLWTR